MRKSGLKKENKKIKKKENKMITFVNILLAIEVIMVWVIVIAILGLILLCIWKLAKIVLKWVKNKKNGGNNETN